MQDQTAAIAAQSTVINPLICSRPIDTLQHARAALAALEGIDVGASTDDDGLGLMLIHQCIGAALDHATDALLNQDRDTDDDQGEQDGDNTLAVRLPAIDGVLDADQTGRVISASVDQGDWIAKGETLISIETASATVDLPSPATGKVAAIIHPGREVAIGDLVAEIRS